MPESLRAVSSLEARALTYPERASKLTINRSEDYVQVGEFVKAVNLLVLEVENTFKPLINEAHRHHKSLIAEMDRHLDPLKTAKTIARTMMISWDKAQEEKRRAEEARLREEARKREEEAKLAAAIEAEASGQKEEAEAIMEEEVYVPPVIVKKEVPKIQGVQFRTIWKFRVTDYRKIPIEYLAPDMVKIGQVVRAMKGTTNITGIEVYEEIV